MKVKVPLALIAHVCRASEIMSVELEGSKLGMTNDESLRLDVRRNFWSGCRLLVLQVTHVHGIRIFKQWKVLSKTSE